MNSTDQAISDNDPGRCSRRRPLWPWILGTVVFTAVALWFCFWWPMHKANRVLSAVKEKGGRFGVSHVSPDWQAAFGDQIHPWFHDVTRIRLGQASLTDQELRDLSALRGVRDLSLNVSRNSEDALQILGRLKQLETIGLSGNGNVLSCDWLRDLPEIRELSFSNVLIPEDCWREIVRSPAEFILIWESSLHPGLEQSKVPRRIYFKQVDLNENSGDALSKLQLTELTVNHCGIDDNFWDRLAALSTLDSLTIIDSKIDAHAMTRIATLSNLTQLHLHQFDSKLMGMSPEQVRLLGRLKSLKQLAISGQSVPDDDSWDALAGLDSLKNLQIEECPLGDAAVAALSNSNSIEFLLLEATNVTDQGISILENLTSLHEVSFRGSDITQQGINRFAKARPDVVFSR